MKVNVPESIKKAWYIVINSNYTLISLDRHGQICAVEGFNVLPSFSLEGKIHLVYRKGDIYRKGNQMSMRELYRDILFVHKSRLFWMDKNSNAQPDYSDVKIGGTI